MSNFTEIHVVGAALINAGERADERDEVNHLFATANVPNNKVVVMRKKKKTSGLMVVTSEPLELDV
jgi:hypothetical protein